MMNGPATGGMTTAIDDVRLVSEASRRLLGEDHSKWVKPLGYPDSLAHCIIDSAFSLRAHYSGVINVRRRYDISRTAADADPTADSVDDLIGAIERAGGRRRPLRRCSRAKPKRPERAA